jgi:metal-sulfur cluster biosynthetic enzyme
MTQQSAAALSGLESELVASMNAIIDPCSAATATPAGLVDMGLLQSLECRPTADGRFRCTVRICVTHAFCMMVGLFVHEIETRLRADARIADVQVEIDHSIIWTEERLSPEYRARLEAQRRHRNLGERSHPLAGVGRALQAETR